MGKTADAFDQCIDFIRQARVFIKNAAILIADPAKAATGLDTGGAKALYRDLDTQLLRQIFEFLIKLFCFHDVHTESVIRTSFQLEKKGACVILAQQMKMTPAS